MKCVLFVNHFESNYELNIQIWDKEQCAEYHDLCTFIL